MKYNYLDVEIQTTQLIEYENEEDYPFPIITIDIDKYITSWYDVINKINIVFKKDDLLVENVYTNYHVPNYGSISYEPNNNGVVLNVQYAYSEEQKIDGNGNPSKEKYMTMPLRMTNTRNLKKYQVAIRVKSLKNYDFDALTQINENKGLFEGSFNYTPNLISGTDDPSQFLGNENDIYIKFTQ